MKREGKKKRHTATAHTHSLIFKPKSAIATQHYNFWQIECQACRPSTFQSAPFSYIYISKSHGNERHVRQHSFYFAFLFHRVRRGRPYLTIQQRSHWLQFINVISLSDRNAAWDFRWTTNLYVMYKWKPNSKLSPILLHFIAFYWFWMNFF